MVRASSAASPNAFDVPEAVCGRTVPAASPINTAWSPTILAGGMLSTGRMNTFERSTNSANWGGSCS